jgi:hypothetical protein
LVKILAVSVDRFVYSGLTTATAQISMPAARAHPSTGQALWALMFDLHQFLKYRCVANRKWLAQNVRVI